MSQFPINWTDPGNIYDPNKIEPFGSVMRTREDFSNVLLNLPFENNLADRSPNGNNGTFIGTPLYVPGKIGNAISLVGTNYVTLGLLPGFTFANAVPFAVECWFRTSYAGGSFMTLMSKQVGGGSPSTPGWSFFIDQFGLLSFTLVGNIKIGNRIQRAVLNTNWRDGILHHAVATYLPTPIGGPYTAASINIYVDGVMPAYQDVPGVTLSQSITNSVACQIGANQGVTPFIGDIDEAVIWKENISLGQAQCRYNNNIGMRRVFNFPDNPTIATSVLAYDPAATTFTRFIETLGAGNHGVIGYQISDDNMTWKHWDDNQQAWVINGINFDTVAVVNTNIPTFPIGYIGVKAFLIAGVDGCNDVELEKTEIGYSLGEAPEVYAGSNKTFDQGISNAPFSDASWYDPDEGTIDHAYFKIPGIVDVYTEIPQGEYSTLIQAVKSFTFLWNSAGVFTAWLQAEDNEQNLGEDSLQVTVSKYLVTFNVTDDLGPVSGINFDPGDGTGYHYVDSPFTWLYNYGPYTVVISPPVNPVKIDNIVVDEQNMIFNFVLTRLLQTSDIPDIAEAVWEVNSEEYTTVGTAGHNLKRIVDSLRGRMKVDDIGVEKHLILRRPDTGELIQEWNQIYDGENVIEIVPLNP